MKKTCAALLTAVLLSSSALAAETLTPYAATLKERAAKGDMAAAYNLALCFHDGKDCKQDDAEAAKWLKIAADKGDVQAINNLAAFYHEGMGVKQDDNQALMWYRAGASHGSAEAEYNLGTFYANGYGMKPDPAMAMKWYERAAKQGLLNAQMDLAHAYMQGTSPDYENAYFWLAVAAKQDDEAAKFRDRVGKTLTAEQFATQQKRVQEFRAVQESETYDVRRGAYP
ncbi:MAG: sel1 repeat family protein [Alphaproteobacteria bacterium]|nr:MAG: sel1 repeat family protein [Alphaproteobacteria bacterium]